MTTHPKTFSVLLAVVEALHRVGEWSKDDNVRLESYFGTAVGYRCLLNFRRCGKNAVGPKVEDWRTAIKRMELHGGKKKGKVMK
jgi:hypothetical protein